MNTVEDERYVELDENIIVDSDWASCQMGDINNNFGKLLEMGSKFRENGAEPIYILDTKTMDVLCISKDLYEKKTH